MASRRKNRGAEATRAKRAADGSAPPLAFAGLWETWTGPNGEELDSAAIITTAANRNLSAIHERMPVFVPATAFDLWLDCANVEADVATALIRPADDGLLEAYEVSLAVNRVANDSEALIAPVPAADAAVAWLSAPAAQAKPKRPKKRINQPSLF
jgi:putative SOS response-associated peptidase YedK